MKHTDGKAAIYVLIMLIGAAMGLIAGGEIMRRIYRQDLSTSAQPNSSGSGSEMKSQASRTDANESQNRSIENTRQSAIVSATQAVAPSVVGIVVTQIQVVRNRYSSDDFFDFFFSPEMMPRYKQVESIGSGFVIREDGMILTNYHVVQNAAKLYVNFSDGRRFEGSVVGFDDRTDLAVIAIKGTKIREVRFGNSDETMIGEWAIAIGNPFLNFINDAHPTVTVGVVSALERNFAPSEGVYYQDMIQTDAAINPGNSGGPLVNALGEVIGINTFIYTGSNSNKGSIGIGFAIPMNRARRVAEEIIQFGQRRSVWTGISVQDLNRSVALALGYESVDGVVVVSVQPGSPGHKAGLRASDIIVKMGNRSIQSHGDIDGFFLDYFVGDEVKIVVVRNNKPVEIQLVLLELPK